jgi:hypothetical protein
MARSSTGTAVAAEAARLAPDLLGGRGTRRYFVAVQDSAELRGGGGLITHFGELVAVDGRLRLERWGPLDELRSGGTPQGERTVTLSAELRRRYGQFADLIRGWTHVNAPPDFPTVAGLIRELYPQSGGTTIDGVIAVDPPGLAALLGLTGPISVAGRAEPVSAANAIDALVADPAARFESRPARDAFLGAVGRGVWESFTTVDVGDPRDIVAKLEDAAGRRHIQVAFFRPVEAAFARDLGAAGELPPVRGDVLGLVTENGSGTSVDAYLHRSIAYEAEVVPRGSTRAAVKGRVRLDFANDAPSAGPAGVIGPDPSLGFKAGQNISMLSLYSALDVTDAAIDGRAVDVTSNRERGRFAHAGVLSVLAGEKASLTMSLSGSVPIHPSGWYSLELHRQPAPSPDDVTVTISVPAGWKIVDTVGFEGPVDQRRATVHFQLDQDRRLSVRMARTGIPGLWDRFRGRWGP